MEVTATLRSAEGVASGRSQPWDNLLLAAMHDKSKGDSIQFDLPDGQIAGGTIGYLRVTNGQVIQVSGELTVPENGRFFFQKQTLPGVAGEFVGVVEFPASERAFRIEPTGPGGTAELVERPLDSVICRRLPRARDSVTNQTAVLAALKPSDFPEVRSPPYQNGVVVLESLPGAAAVLYLDFQGGYTHTWGGIQYERPNLSNVEIRQVWMRVAEDFMPFDINVTTDLSVYESASAVSRQRVIITPTTAAGPDLGGVSYVGSFNWAGDVPCWVFELQVKACAEACSHELGHTLGLGHKGKASPYTEYYLGHGTGELGWAPIMGVGYYRNVSQWSKGDYYLANDICDDLTVITTRNNSVSYRPDDTGDTLATARYLELYPNDRAGGEGLIECTGDTDAFQFTTSGGEISLRADPVAAGPNLALEVALYDPDDVLLVRTQSQNGLWAAIRTNLASGTYTFRVAGTGRGDPLSSGFSSYGSLGYYSITGQVSNARLPTRFVLPEGATNGTVLGCIPPPQLCTNALAYRIASCNQMGLFAIDNSGSLSVADIRLLYYATQGRKNLFPVQVELFVEIMDGVAQSLLEADRRVVVLVPPGIGAPMIILQPSDLMAAPGEDVCFAVGATEEQPPLDCGWFFTGYQWFFNAVALAGATNAVLNLNDVQAADSGKYFAVIANSMGTVTSRVASLTVTTAPPVTATEVMGRMTASAWLPDGAFALFSSKADVERLVPSVLARFEAQASTNLIDWVALTNTITVTNEMLFLVDPEAVNHRVRFYRLRER